MHSTHAKWNARQLLHHGRRWQNKNRHFRTRSMVLMWVWQTLTISFRTCFASGSFFPFATDAIESEQYLLLSLLVWRAQSHSTSKHERNYMECIIVGNSRMIPKEIFAIHVSMSSLRTLLMRFWLESFVFTWILYVITSLAHVRIVLAVSTHGYTWLDCTFLRISCPPEHIYY